MILKVLSQTQAQYIQISGSEGGVRHNMASNPRRRLQTGLER